MAPPRPPPAAAAGLKANPAASLPAPPPCGLAAPRSTVNARFGAGSEVSAVFFNNNYYFKNKNKK